MSLLTLLEAAKYLESAENGAAVPRGKTLFLAIASRSFFIYYLFYIIFKNHLIDCKTRSIGVLKCIDGLSSRFPSIIM